MKAQLVRLVILGSLVSILSMVACDDSTSSAAAGPALFSVTGTGSTAGDSQVYTQDGLSFTMKYVPGGTFPLGVSDSESASVTSPYWLSETEVTYELWSAVYSWATDPERGNRQYDLNHSGLMGLGAVDDDQNPVTLISWRDAIVWCNALTEYYNASNGENPDLSCVYYTDSSYTAPLRAIVDTAVISYTLPGSQDNPYIMASANDNTDMDNCIANGFRLATANEWECAARYKDGTTWTPGSYASGASADYNDETATKSVAVYDVTSTAIIKSKAPNALGIYDMSGNVSEFCYDWYRDNIGLYRINHGGNCYSETYYLRVGLQSGSMPYKVQFGGIRLARNTD